MDKKILVRTDQAKTTRGNNVVVFDELRNWMIMHPQPRDCCVEGECAVEAG
jgi:hypothetical protein